jgi:hypothetical protein
VELSVRRPRGLVMASLTLVVMMIPGGVLALGGASSSASPDAHAAASPLAAQRSLGGTQIARQPGTLRPGTPVRSREVLKRVFLNAQRGFALAAVGGAQYPASTSNGGRRWLTSGPALHLDAAQAPLAVLEVGVLSSKVYFAAGGGEVVDATPDAGRRWYQTLFPGGVLGVIPADGKLVAVIEAYASSPASTWAYSSGDGGRTWRYVEGS